MKNTILGKIINDKKNWVNLYKKKYSLDNIKYLIKPSNRNFYDALSSQNTIFILECKKASPSQGIIRQNFCPTTIANTYKQYASVISVLTDEKYFHGNFDFLRQISNVVTQPLLCKDFFIDQWQVYFARLHKADGILLMLSVLDDNTYLNLSTIAHSLGMGVLTEIINKDEWERAISLKAKIIGINNRNFYDLSIDLNRTRTLARNKTNEITVISESGISSYKQIRELSQYVNGFLIGSSLMSEAKLNTAIRKLILGENKVCGLTRIIDAQAAYNVGSVYGGLIFIPESPRYIDKITAYNITSNVTLLHYVGIFKNAPLYYIVKMAFTLKLSAIQLHGEENQHYINVLHSQLPKNCHIWKTFNMKKELPKLNLKNVNRYVLDSGGGSGKTFNWSLLHGMILDNVILAGGLTENNCCAASMLGCAGLDFNSGVESTPGIKDHHKLTTIFKILRNY